MCGSAPTAAASVVYARWRDSASKAGDMNTTMWIVLGATAGVVLIYFLVMRVFFRQSRALDRQIDSSKMRKWGDEDCND
jgi:hypothetical protein